MVAAEGILRRQRIGPAMQWAKPRRARTHLYEEDSHRIDIGFSEGDSVSEELLSRLEDAGRDEVFSDNLQAPYELQGSSSKDAGKNHEDPEVQNPGALRPAQQDNEESAWNYYSQQWSRIVGDQNEKALFGRVKDSFRSGTDAIDPQTWTTSAASSDPMSTTSPTSYEASDPGDQPTSWLIYVLPALVIIGILVLGVMTLSG